MASHHQDPRIRAARRIARGLGIAGGLLILTSGTVPLPDLPGVDAPGPWAASEAGREALRWVRAAVGAAIAVLLALGAWERRQERGEAVAPRVPPERPPGGADA